MLNHHRIKPWGIFFSFFIFLSTLFFYGFVRDGTWIVIAVLLIPLYRRIGLPNFFLFSISFFLATIISIFIIETKIYKRKWIEYIQTESELASPIALWTTQTLVKEGRSF